MEDYNNILYAHGESICVSTKINVTGAKKSPKTYTLSQNFYFLTFTSSFLSNLVRIFE